MSLRILLPGICLFFLFFLFSNCQNDADPAAKITEGHKRMVAMLDSINRNADPMNYLHVNLRKIAYYEQLMQQKAGDEALLAQFNYADQLLRSGKNEAAIVQYQNLIQKIGDQLVDNTKMLYEMLALAYMRLGEQANCIETHSPESCILPIRGAGIYKLKAGPENAVKIYERILAQYPDDLLSRWLLNLAHMAMGQWPAGVPARYLFPADIFQAPPSDILFRDIAIPLGIDVQGISGSVCMEDFDNDGNLDLFMTSYGLGDQARYFHNNGDGTFSERTQEANLTGILSGLNAIHADYDNDGDRDIFILRGAWLYHGKHPNSLLRNNGDGTFTDVTIYAGLLSFNPTQTADWADYDGDGWLDLFVGNETYRPEEPNRCELFHNNGDGTFSNIAPQIGLAAWYGFPKAVVWGDINNDQRPDLYISNLVGDNLLLVNQGGTAPDKWSFQNMANNTSVQYPQNSFPAFFFDYNNDGFEDIFSTHFPVDYEGASVVPLLQEYTGKQPEGDWLRLYRNNGNSTFTDVHRELGLHTITFAMGNNFGDLDNDGWPDIYLGTGKPDLRALIPNRVFHNRNGTRFEDISMNGFSQIQKGHGVAFGDIDNDGDQDIYVVVGGAFEGDLGHNILYENPGNSNHWLTLFVEGVKSNRDAIGARVRVNVRQPDGGTRAIRATVGTGGSFGANSLRQEIGLGDATEIESVEIQWPRPGVPNSTFTGLQMDAAYRLKEGATAAEPVALKRIVFKK
ncbi:MAG: FG-GAP-like repeat-containing protein [Saprospiraceae bacterium]